MVLEKPTKAARREALAILPLELSDAYAGMLARIQKLSHSPHPVSNLGMRILMWLHIATRPLRLEELQYALAVVLKEGKRGNIDLDKDQIPTKKRLLDCCLGLVVVDDETMTVRFVHYTLEEYFKRDDQNNKYFPDHNKLAAQICLTYLNFSSLTTYAMSQVGHGIRGTSFEGMSESFPFLQYASDNWGQYAAQPGCSEAVEALAMKLLQADSGCQYSHVSFEVLHRKLRTEYGYYDPVGPGESMFRGIHAAASFGLAPYMNELGKDYGWDPKDNYNRTPLSWAAENGHEAVVRLLVEREDVDADSKNNNGRTPLSWAAEKGHEADVQILRGHSRGC